jgi:hypothetical protein
MKILVVLFAFLSSSPVWANLQNVTMNNAKVATENFNKKLLKGKLDEKGYGRLREIIGKLGTNEALQTGYIMSVVGATFAYDGNHRMNKWFVPVYRTFNGSAGDKLPIFTALVRCDIYRTRQPIKYGRYQWYPNCKVEYILQ